MDCFHFYGSDLQVSPSGDLLLADDQMTGMQRIYRRLLTNPQLLNGASGTVASGDYIAHQTYGAGVARKVGSPQEIPATTALIRGQMLLESVVARKPQPQITLTPIIDGMSAVIQYTDANTATPQFISFDINS